MSNEGEENDQTSAHLDDVDDGAGCTEIWTKMSEVRSDSDAGRAEVDD